MIKRINRKLKNKVTLSGREMYELSCKCVYYATYAIKTFQAAIQDFFHDVTSTLKECFGGKNDE